MPLPLIIDRDRGIRSVSISASVGENELLAASTGVAACLLGFLLVPDGDGTFQFKSDDTVGGAGTEVALSGVMKMKDGIAVGFRSDAIAPILFTGPGLALTLELVTSTAKGFAIVAYAAPPA